MSKINSQKSTVSRQAGLTFIEAIIVIGIIVILAATVIMIIRPDERLAKSRDEQREIHLNAIWHAVNQKIQQESGTWTGCDPIPDGFMTLISSDYFDLYSCLIPDYLATPLFDPVSGYYNNEENYDTKYRIWQDPNTKKISLRVEGEVRLVYLGDPDPPTRLVYGYECEDGTDCESGYCVDGYCCNTACDQTCWACDVDPGTCAFALAGAEDATCPTDGVSCIGSCGWEKYDGMCDGGGGCRIVEADIPLGYVCEGEGNKTGASSDHYCGTGSQTANCDSGSCAGTMISPHFSCDGQGSCRTEYDPDYDYEYHQDVYASKSYVFTDACEDSASVTAADTCKWCQGEGQADPAFQFYDERGTGQDYKTVLINGQCWMAQGMNVGTRIDGEFAQGTGCGSINKYCYNDNEDNCNTVQTGYTYSDGGLYQWGQAMCGSTTEGVQGICPDSWHIPTNAEWDALVTAVGENPGTKLQPNGNSGFEGNLAGHRNTGGGFAGRADYAGFWVSTEYESNTAWYWSLYDNDESVYKLIFDKNGGFSVRCILD